MAAKLFLSLRCSSVKISRIAPSSSLDKAKICLPNSWVIGRTRHWAANFRFFRVTPAEKVFYFKLMFALQFFEADFIDVLGGAGIHGPVECYCTEVVRRGIVGHAAELEMNRCLFTFRSHQAEHLL